MYSIQEVSKKTGLSSHTLRYYEKEGLLPDIRRSPAGFRQYTEADLEILGLICCLKDTGMSLREIARFVALTRGGEPTLPDRAALLQAHRDRVSARAAELQTHLRKLDQKLACLAQQLQAAGKEARET